MNTLLSPVVLSFPALNPSAVFLLPAIEFLTKDL